MSANGIVARPRTFQRCIELRLISQGVRPLRGVKQV